jgi:hypothetical protein
MAIKRSSKIYFDDTFRSGVFDIYAFYDLCLKAHARRLQALEEGAVLATEYFQEEETLMDDVQVLRDLRCKAGYATTIMLYSELENTLLRALKYLGKSKSSLNKWYSQQPFGNERVGFLEKSARFFEAELGLNFSAGVRVTHRETTLLPDDLDLDFKVKDIDYRRLKDFVWARNQIVHERGLATRAEANEHHMPLVGLIEDEIEDEVEAPKPRRLPMDLRKEWVEMATQHLIAFVDSVAQALRIRERPDSAVSQNLL